MRQVILALIAVFCISTTAYAETLENSVDIYTEWNTLSPLTAEYKLSVSPFDYHDPISAELMIIFEYTSDIQITKYKIIDSIEQNIRCAKFGNMIYCAGNKISDRTTIIATLNTAEQKCGIVSGVDIKIYLNNNIYVFHRKSEPVCEKLYLPYVVR